MTESPTFRTFIGIPLPEGVQDELDFWLEAREQTSPNSASGPRQIPSANRHVTLHFLGNLSNRERTRLCQNLSQVLKNTTAFELILDKLEYFPDAKSPIVAATCETTPALDQLWILCAEALQQSHLQHLISTRKFRPHITLIRNRRCQQELEYTERNDKPGLPAITFPVEQVSLYDSQINHLGSSYRAIHTVTLNQ